MEPLGFSLVSCHPQGGVERQQVLFGRVVLGRKGRLTSIIEQVVGSVAGQFAVKPVGKTVDPIGCRIIDVVTAKFR